MKYQFVRQSNDSQRLIAVFAGWAMDPSVFGSLTKQGFDIVVFYDYRGSAEEMKSLFEKITSTYDETFVIAWSFGVAIANSLLNRNISTAIAVNGTSRTVDNRKGIPRHVYSITLRSLSPANLLKFYHTVFGERLPERLPVRDIEELREELTAMGSVGSDEASPYWSKIYISENDAIIPAVNQQSAWTGYNVEILRDQHHFIDFQKIIDNDIIDKEFIARRFSDSFSEYEKEAVVQRETAAELYRRWIVNQDLSGKKILEIGIGTGFLTRLYNVCDISGDSVAVDLADVETVRKALSVTKTGYAGKIVSDDAENFITLCNNESFDAIVSASTIQWFCRLKDFFNKVADVLRPGGIGAFSTFEKGTFVEIKNITGRSPNYPTLEQLISILPPELEIIDTFRENKVIKFENGRMVMKHIKATGVNSLGSPTDFGSTKRLIEYLDTNPQLTYRTLYLIVRKRI